MNRVNPAKQLSRARRWVAGAGVLAGVAALGSTARAGVIAADDYESYGAGAQVEDNAGVQLNGGAGWTAPYTVRDEYRSGVTVADTSGSPLAYSAGGVSVAGGSRALRVSVADSGNNIALGRQFANQTSTVYLSFLYRSTEGDVTPGSRTSDGDFTQVGLHNIIDNPVASVVSNLFGDVGPGADGGFAFAARDGNGGDRISDNRTVAGETYFLVLKAQKSGAGANYDVVTLYRNPTSITEGDNVAVVESTDASSADTSSTGQSSLDSLVLRLAFLEGSEVFEIDQVVVGTDFASVVPEPAGGLLLGAAATGWGLLRRKRRDAGRRGVAPRAR